MAKKKAAKGRPKKAESDRVVKFSISLLREKVEWVDSQGSNRSAAISQLIEIAMVSKKKGKKQ